MKHALDVLYCVSMSLAVVCMIYHTIRILLEDD